MNSFKKYVIMGTGIIALFAVPTSVFAASTNTTPAEITAKLTGKSLESVIKEREEDNKTYGTIANEAGKLDEFQEEMLAAKKAILENDVANGKITQEQADTILATLKENLLNCDGSGTCDGAGDCGYGFGQGQSNGEGNGTRNGNGYNRGCGQRRGYGNN